MAHEPPRLHGPIPEGDQPHDRRRRSTHARARPNLPVPTSVEIQGMLAQLVALLGMGIISPQTANAMRSILSELLRAQSQAAGTAAGPIDLQRLQDMLAQQPMLIDLLTPVLTTEQLARLLAANDEDPQ
jgi:hypothetical protein